MNNISRAASVGPVAIPWIDRRGTRREHKRGEVGQITEGAPWAPLGAARYAQSAVRSCPLTGPVLLGLALLALPGRVKR